MRLGPSRREILLGKRSFLELNEGRFDNYLSTMSRFVAVYRRERRGSRVLVVESSSTSDETSRLVLVGMQWFNEPTATVNLRNSPESQRIPEDCVASERRWSSSGRKQITSPGGQRDDGPNTLLPTGLACPIGKDKARRDKETRSLF